MIPPLQPALRIAEAAGVIARDFHRWLQLVERALQGPFIGWKEQPSTVIDDEQYGLHADELLLAGTDALTIKGSGVLVICG